MCLIRWNGTEDVYYGMLRRRNILSYRYLPASALTLDVTLVSGIRIGPGD